VPPEKLLKALIVGNLGLFHTNALVVRRSLFERTGLLDESMKFHQDVAIMIKMAASGCLVAGRIQEPVAIRRVHGRNRILSLGTGYNPHLEKLDNALLQWGRQNGLDRSKLRLLSYKRWLDSLFGFDSGLRNNFYDIKMNGLPGMRLAQMAVFIIGRFARNPSLMVSPNFFLLVLTQMKKIVGRTAGVKRRSCSTP
jgi:hypothetical protein